MKTFGKCLLSLLLDPYMHLFLFFVFFLLYVAFVSEPPPPPDF